MEDTSHTPKTLRVAGATASLHCLPSTIEAIHRGKTPGPDPLPTARVAGIQAAKNPSLFIPDAHHVALDFVEVTIELKDASILIYAEVKAVWNSGVEIEALTAATAAALALYEMLRTIDNTMEIDSLQVVSKKGELVDGRMEEIAKLRTAILVISHDHVKGSEDELSGKAAKTRLEKLGTAVVEYKIIPYDKNQIESELQRLTDVAMVDIVITTGGVGIGPEDITPDATSTIIDRRLPGVEEFLRMHLQERAHYGILSRGIAGIRGKTVIINLPASRAVVYEAMDGLFPWLFDSLKEQ